MLTLNPIHAGIFLAGVVPWGRGGVFHLHPVTPLSLKLDDLNFVQHYLGAGSIFWDKKNLNQIHNNVNMTSSLHCRVLKTAYIKITAASLSLIEPY